MTRTQLPSLRRRLVFFAFLLPTISLAHAPRQFDTGLIITQQLLSIVLPWALLLTSAWMVDLRQVRVRGRVRG